jgi:hypothetical protein
MAEGALGISTGIGQGEAQIIKPFQSPVTPQQYGSVMAAQQKAQQDKKDKQGKALASVADFQFKGLPQHAELFAKGYNDVIDFAVQNIDDPLIEFKLKQKMADLNTKANLSVDLKTNLQKQADAIQQGEGKNYFLGFDEAVKDVVSPVDYNTFLDTGKWGQTLGEKANKLNSVKTVPIYDVGKAKSALQNQVGGWAKDNLQGRTWETPETVIDGVVEAELTGHPEAIVHFGKVMQNDPVGAKEAGGDPYQYGFNALKKDLKAKGFTPEGKGNTNIINVGGGEEGTGVSDVAPQTFDMNLENIGGQSPVTLSFDADGYSFTPVQASRAVPSNTFTLDGKPYTKQGIVNMAIGAVLDMPVANRDINVNGRTFKAGQPIPQEFVAFMNQEPNKYRNVVNFKKMATALVDDADQITFDLNEAENLISTNQKWGKAGYGKYKSNQTKLDTKGRYKELYPNLFGRTTQPTGGAKTTSGKKTKTGEIDLSDF